MPLTAGTRLGPYEILASIGAGGMGEVYRARDTRLDRTVAVKVLPEPLAADTHFSERFEREARTISSLDHPNICTLHDVGRQDGRSFLVMQFLEGGTLAGTRELTVAQAVDIARQVALGLEAAHERGIVHRDLKPANIFITGDGTAKILDFGLAKDTTAGPAGAALSLSPTMVTDTIPGVVLGTAAYMSPEQARGLTIDKRTDIWAFGCVLFEMLTGQRAFPGEDVTDFVVAVMTKEPDWARLPANTPPRLVELMKRCLKKDPRERLRDIGDARIELLQGDGVVERGIVAKTSLGRELIAWSAAAVSTIAAVVVVGFAVRPVPAPPEMRVEITTPPTTDPDSFAISPDGQKLIFVATSEGQPRLWLRSLTTASVQVLAGTEGATLPFWSPDGKSVAFFADSKLKRIETSGGSPRVLASAIFGSGGSWNRDGTILFAPTAIDVIYRVASTGSEPVAVSHMDRPRETAHTSPHWLPDGRHFLYYADGSPDARGVYLASLGDSSAWRILDTDSDTAVAPPNHLLFVRQHSLLVQRLDADRHALAGDPFVVAETGASSPEHVALTAAGDAHLLAYRLGGPSDARQLLWFDRAGKKLAALGAVDFGAISQPHLSPDGRRIAIDRTVAGNDDIWLMEAARGMATRLTSDPAPDRAPLWSPDGTRIVFGSTRGTGTFNLYQKRVSGMETEELLLELALETDVQVCREGRPTSPGELQ